MKDRCILTGGVALILLGLALLFQAVFPSTWAMVLIGLGTAFLVAAAVHHLGALAIPGAIIGGVGALLLWQSVTGNWASWLVLWPLVPGTMGAGFVLANLLGMGGAKIRLVGWVWMVEAVVMVVALSALRVLFPFWFSWALILVGLGAMFLLAAVLAGVPAKAIPGAIVGGLGLMLYWQNATGDWESWSYAWPLVPAFVGLGLVVANALGMGGRAVRRVGWSLVGWHLAVALMFAAFFALDGRFAHLWPLVLVFLGLWVLARPFARERRRTREAI
jgi:hypothetical protein